MTITALMDLSKLPNQSQDQTVFDANMAYLIDNLPERGRQENELAANLNAIAAGGAYAIPYIFDTATADAAPGADKLRLSSSTQNASTVMRLGLTAGGQNYTSVLDTFDASTSTVKGSIRLVKFGDLTRWMTFDVIARAAPSGYRNLTVVCTGSSSTSPFANTDGLILLFQRTGDKGDAGSLSTMLIRDQKASGAAAQSLPGGAWTKRTHNTTVHNSIPGASLSSDEVLLPVGTYLIHGTAPAAAGATHQARLFNVTDNVLCDVGTSEGMGAGQTSVSRSVLQTVLVVTGATKRYRVDHFANNTVAGGLPVSSGASETYTQTSITKIG